MQELLTTKQSAEFLGVTRRTIQNYRKNQILIPHVFDKNGHALYTKNQLICAIKKLLEGCEKLNPENAPNCERIFKAPSKGVKSSDKSPKFQLKSTKSSTKNLKFRPRTKKHYEKVLRRYSGEENFKIMPITKKIVPTFKLCKVIYNLEQDKYLRMVVDGKPRRIIEKRNHKKFGDLLTVYRISNRDNFSNIEPLNEFDYAVFSVCASYFDNGYQCITPAIIYRALTGKGNTARVTPDLREAIIISLKKLISTVIEIDELEINSAFNYADSDQSKHRSPILPAHFDEKFINGNKTPVICFDKESSLMEIAKRRNQFLHYNISLLNAPSIRNTFMNITLKNYILRRVIEIKTRKQLKPAITFDDIFKKCRISESHSEIKSRARKIIVKFFEYLQINQIIKSFTVTKEKNTFSSINFTYRKPVDDCE